MRKKISGAKEMPRLWMEIIYWPRKKHNFQSEEGCWLIPLPSSFKVSNFGGVNLPQKPDEVSFQVYSQWFTKDCTKDKLNP